MRNSDTCVLLECRNGGSRFTWAKETCGPHPTSIHCQDTSDRPTSDTDWSDPGARRWIHPEGYPPPVDNPSIVQSRPRGLDQSRWDQSTL
eukprot:2433961-Prymnesium_polylepis.1